MVFNSKDLPYSYISKKRQEHEVSIEFDWANEDDSQKIEQLSALLNKNLNIDYRSFKELEKDMPQLYENQKKQKCLIATLFYHFYHFEQNPKTNDILNEIKKKYPYLDNIESLRLFVWDFIGEHYLGFVNRNQRKAALKNISDDLGIEAYHLDSILWSDYESQKILIRYRSIDPKIAVYLYNFHLLETILQNSNSITFFIPNLLGYITKNLIFKLKFTPLYFEINKIRHDKIELKNVMAYLKDSNDIYQLRITIPKEISAPKINYGNFLSNIVFYLFQNLQSFSVKFYTALNLKIKKRKYFWMMKNTFLNSIRYPWNIMWEKIESFSKFEQDISENSNSTEPGIDSLIENAFLLQFRDKEWSIKSEPKTIILNDGSIFIPDFVLSNDFSEILVEIIGFWTEDYIKSKIGKLKKFRKEKNNTLILLIARVK
jgi:predicted nuclease of restriction endonuclease-like RecB superfamily